MKTLKWISKSVVACVLFTSSTLFAGEQTAMQNSQAMPNTIARLIVSLCYEEPASGAHETQLQCPSQEEFDSFLSDLASVDPYRSAIRERAQKLAISDSLTLVNRSLQQTALGYTSKPIPNPNIKAFISQNYFARLRQLKSSEVVMSNVLLGLFQINLEETTGHQFKVTEEIFSFLSEFKTSSGELLFDAGLFKIKSANRLSDLGVGYKDLVLGQNWIEDPAEREWESTTHDVHALYLNLITQYLATNNIALSS